MTAFFHQSAESVPGLVCALIVLRANAVAQHAIARLVFLIFIPVSNLSVQCIAASSSRSPPLITPAAVHRIKPGTFCSNLCLAPAAIRCPSLREGYGPQL